VTPDPLGDALLSCLLISDGHDVLIYRSESGGTRLWTVSLLTPDREVIGRSADLTEALQHAVRNLKAQVWKDHPSPYVPH
jgi:hypothetical protein